MASAPRDAMSIVFNAAGHLVGRPRRVVLDSLTVDATLTDTVQGSSEATKHPIEDGSLVSDHVIAQPREYRMEGVISNFPLGVLDFVLREQAGLSGFVADAGAQLKGAPTRVDDAYSLLQDMLDKRDVVTVVTPLRTYVDMVMVSLQITRDNKTGDALHFTAGFQQITKVATQTVAAASLPRAADTSQSGRLPTTAAPKSVESDTTVLRGITNGLGLTKAGE